VTYFSTSKRVVEKLDEVWTGKLVYKKITCIPLL